jgi:hypothetical protein
VADVRLAVFIQGCGYAENQSVALIGTAKILGGFKAAFTGDAWLLADWGLV